MLHAEQPDRSSTTTASTDDRPRLSAAPGPGEDHPAELRYEDGLLRSVVTGAFIGFSIVFGLVCGGLLLAGFEVAYVIPSAVFVSAFGGIGFGAMQAAALHKPRLRLQESPTGTR